MRKVLNVLAASAMLLAFTGVPADAAKKQPVVKTSAACKPSDSGKVYRDYNDCLTLNQKAGWGSRTGQYCSKFCSQ